MAARNLPPLDQRQTDISELVKILDHVPHHKVDAGLFEQKHHTSVFALGSVNPSKRLSKKRGPQFRDLVQLFELSWSAKG